MCRNRISNDGAKAMALYFQLYDTLQQLDISSNRIEAEGASDLATSLIQSSVSGNLTWLNIGDNSFKSEFAQFALNDLIKGATQLTYLNISDIGYDNEDAAETLKSAIEESKCKGTLEHLDWSYDACDMDDFIPQFLALFTRRSFILIYWITSLLTIAFIISLC